MYHLPFSKTVTTITNRQSQNSILIVLALLEVGTRIAGESQLLFSWTNNPDTPVALTTKWLSWWFWSMSTIFPKRNYAKTIHKIINLVLFKMRLQFLNFSFQNEVLLNTTSFKSKTVSNTNFNCLYITKKEFEIFFSILKIIF